MNYQILELIALLLLSLFLLVGAVLIWRKRFTPGCALIGAAAGIAGPLFCCGFGVAVSSFNAFVFFDVRGQDVLEPLWNYPDAAQAEAVAARLNTLLLIVGRGSGLPLVCWPVGCCMDSPADGRTGAVHRAGAPRRVTTLSPYRRRGARRQKNNGPGRMRGKLSAATDRRSRWSRGVNVR
jgi:hypothetical protein